MVTAAGTATSAHATCSHTARLTHADRARWERPSLLLLLAASAVGYLWNLGSIGYGNSFYAAAVQAGTTSWKAFLFGSLDPANFITVDKPPASLWVMELSGRLFGFGPWSLLVPQVLMAVGAVALLHTTVRRVAGPVPALVAGALLALTPVAVLMFRYDNPDALLALLLTAAGYTTVRAVQAASTRWLLLTGLLIGLAFLTKELQAFLAVPGLALAYLWAAPTGFGRRIGQLLGAGLAIVVGAGWWILAVALWPASERPYLGGSGDNSELGRALGYNGLSRLLGGGRPFGGAGAPDRGGLTPLAGRAGGLAGAGRGVLGDRGRVTFGAFGGRAGFTRMFGTEVAGQISWLLPAALILLVAGLWLTRRAPRTDLARAVLLMFGGWLVVGALVLSLMQGTFHPYYTLVLAPPLAGLVAVGGREVWQIRHGRSGQVLLAAGTAVTAVWSYVVLERTPSFAPGLAWAVLVAGLLVAAGFLLTGRGRWTAVLLGTAVLVGLAGPAAYAIDTVATPQSGPLVAAGPSSAAGRGPAALARGDRLPGRSGFADLFGRPGGGRGEVVSDPELDALLRSAGTRWSAATAGSSAAASLELASGTAVMGIGGFTGSDPAPTLAQFQADVRTGQVHYLVGGSGGRRGGAAGEITAWVQQSFPATTVGGLIVYDLRPA